MATRQPWVSVSASASVTQLQHALDHSRRRERRFQSEIVSLKKIIHSPKKSFLLELPVEIRNEIYKLLLVNSILGEHAAISPQTPHDGWGANVTYDLFPAILYVCKTINAEATDVLYGSNTFIISCIDFNLFGHTGRTVTSSNPSPLSRYARDLNLRSETHHLTSSLDTSNFPAFHRVRRWNSIVVRRFYENGNISPSLQYFCEAACKNSLQSLKFTVYNVHYVKEWLHDFTVEPNGLNAIESGGTTQMWEPLKLFRNLSSLEFESNPKTSNPAFERDLKTLTTSNEPVVHVFAMYRQLLAYTRAFERHHSFRAAMDTSKLVQSLPAQHAVSLAGGGWNGDMPLHLIDTPFRDFTNRRGSTWGHPVELGLWRARVTSDHNDLAPFKIERAGVVWSLESQYQRIMAAETTFRQYIKAEKMKWGMLEVNRQRGKTTHATNTHQKMAEGLVHLENFASTFARDLAFQVTCNLRDRRRVFDEIYSTTSGGQNSVRTGHIARTSKSRLN